MQWRVPQPIAVIEAGTQAVAGLQGFDIAVSRRQVDVLVVGHEAAQAGPAANLRVALGAE